jgi:hypothetical protein
MLIIDLTNEKLEKAFYNYCERGDLASVHALFKEPRFFKADIFATAYEKAIASGNIDLLKYFKTYLDFDYSHDIFNLEDGAHTNAFQVALEKKQDKVLEYFSQDASYISSIDRFLINYDHPLQYALKHNLPIELFSLLVEKIHLNPKKKDPHKDSHDLLHLSIIADNAIYSEYLLKNFHFSFTEMNYDSRLKKSMCYLDYAEKKKNVPKILQTYTTHPTVEDKIIFAEEQQKDEGKKYKL